MSINTCVSLKNRHVNKIRNTFVMSIFYMIAIKYISNNGFLKIK